MDKRSAFGFGRLVLLLDRLADRWNATAEELLGDYLFLGGQIVEGRLAVGATRAQALGLRAYWGSGAVASWPVGTFALTVAGRTGPTVSAGTVTLRARPTIAAAFALLAAVTSVPSVTSIPSVASVSPISAPTPAGQDGGHQLII